MRHEPPPAPRATKVPEVRKGDTVVILTGKDAGKRGTVDRIVRPDRVVIEGLNIAKRHTKPRQSGSQTDRAPQIQSGGILDVAQSVSLSNVMVVCPRCEKVTRVGHATLGSGKRARVCRHCGEQLEARA